MTLTDRALTWAFTYGPRLPEAVLRAGASLAATGVWLARTKGVRQLERNLATVRPQGAHAVRDGSRRALQHYFRYYAEVLHLEALTPEQIDARVEVRTPAGFADHVTRGSIVVALGHCGNWDLAGAWAGRHLSRLLTVAERLKPEEVFRAFVKVREDVGMRILPLERGRPIFSTLLRETRLDRYTVALLADRDLGRGGVPAVICEQPARVAAGPAALATATKAPLFFAGIRHVRLRGQRRRAAGSPWGIVIEFFGPYHTEERGRAATADLTRQWTRDLSRYLRAYPLHWHMLQPVFDRDLDLDRIRAKQGAEGAS
ncbi:MAG: phosphatidylinositol mannoside acyltransferase [Bowdeniella nasicola]|nr:phosphatidylinositol mannoside acyltransferase [Bowdeniella nasicola]